MASPTTPSSTTIRRTRDFKKKRPNPNVIQPGDEVYIPPLEQKTVDCATDGSYRFQVKRPPAKIQVYVRELGEPLAQKPYVLDVAGTRVQGETDGDGLVQADVPPDATEAVLTFPGTELAFLLQLGALDPLTEVSGVRDRLQNLGYDCGEGNTEDDDLKAVLQRFQDDRGIDPSGALDDATRAQLGDSHDQGQVS